MPLISIILEAIKSFLAPLVFYLKGRSDNENKHLNEDRKALKTARDIRHKLNSDPDYRKRVRERFKKR